MDALGRQSVQDFKVLVVDNGSSERFSASDIFAFMSRSHSASQVTSLDSQNHALQVMTFDDGHEIKHITHSETLRILQLEENRGFAGGVNAGLKEVDTKYVILLNNDTIVDEHFVEVLEREIEKDEKIFAVSAQMIKASDHELIDSAGDGITLLGWAYQRGIDEDRKLYQKPMSVFSACAGAAIYRKDVLDKIGFFDEMHFAYLEDIDLSWRARLAGYKIKYSPEAKVFHLGSATSGSKYNSFKVKLTSRNNIYLQYKNQPVLQLIINFIPLLLGVLGKAVFFKKMGYEKDYWAGIKEGLETRRQCTKAPHAKYGILSYIAIEWMMIVGMIEYTISFTKRHI